MDTGGHWAFFICFLAVLPFGICKEEPLYSEYIPKNVEELQRLSVAMNCVFNHYGKPNEINQCISCFFPLTGESLKCYEQFFNETSVKKCEIPKLEEFNAGNKENIIYNLTACADYNLRAKIIDSCVETTSVSEYQKRDRLIYFVELCVEKNMNIAFAEGLEALKSTDLEPVKATCEDILDKIYQIEIISKCEEVNENNIKECKACFNEVLSEEGTDMAKVFKDSLACSDQYLNSVFGKCFNSENFSGKSFENVYEVKRSMGMCLHKNTDTILKNICTFNLPGNYVTSPKQQEIYSLVSACIDYHHIQLHNTHYNQELKDQLFLHDQYVMAIDGITEEVQNYFKKITVATVTHQE